MVITLAATLVVAIVAVSYALVIDKDSGTFGGKISVVDVELHEDFYTSNQFGDTLDTPDPNGVDRDSKIFWGESKGGKKCYVRAKIVTTFEWYNEDTSQWENASIPQSAIQYMVNAPGWIEGDDYWYYSKILLPASESPRSDSVTTKVYVLDVKLTSEVPEFYADKTLRYIMHVQMESSQATHQAYKYNFGFTGTQDLPVGVERLPAEY